MKKIKIDRKLWSYISFVFEHYGIESLLKELLIPYKNMDLTADIFTIFRDFNDEYKSELRHYFAAEDFDRTLGHYEKMKLNFLVLAYYETRESYETRGYESYPFEKYFYCGSKVFFFFDKREDNYTYKEMIDLFKSEPGCCLITKYPLEPLHTKMIAEDVLRDIVKGTTAIILDIYDGDSYLHIDLTNIK